MSFKKNEKDQSRIYIQYCSGSFFVPVDKREVEREFGLSIAIHVVRIIFKIICDRKDQRARLLIPLSPLIAPNSCPINFKA